MVPRYRNDSSEAALLLTMFIITISIRPSTRNLRIPFGFSFHMTLEIAD